MKGIELPINIMIIFIIALIVLVAVGAFFMGVWKPTASGVGLDAAKSLACKDFVATGCSNFGIPVRDYDIDGDGKFDPGLICMACDNGVATGSYVDCSGTPHSGSCGGTVRTTSDTFGLICAKFCPPYMIGWSGADWSWNANPDFLPCCKRLCGCT